MAETQEALGSMRAKSLLPTEKVVPVGRTTPAKGPKKVKLADPTRVRSSLVDLRWDGFATAPCPQTTLSGLAIVVHPSKMSHLQLLILESFWASCPLLADIRISIRNNQAAAN